MINDKSTTVQRYRDRLRHPSQQVWIIALSLLKIAILAYDLSKLLIVGLQYQLILAIVLTQIGTTPWLYTATIVRTIRGYPRNPVTELTDAITSTTDLTDYL